MKLTVHVHTISLAAYAAVTLCEASSWSGVPWTPAWEPADPVNPSVRGGEHRMSNRRTITGSAGRDFTVRFRQILTQRYLRAQRQHGRAMCRAAQLGEHFE